MTEAMGIVTAEVSLWDPKVCRSFVAGTCVHDLFANTVSSHFSTGHSLSRTVGC